MSSRARRATWCLRKSCSTSSRRSAKKRKTCSTWRGDSRTRTCGTFALMHLHVILSRSTDAYILTLLNTLQLALGLPDQGDKGPRRRDGPRPRREQQPHVEPATRACATPPTPLDSLTLPLAQRNGHVFALPLATLRSIYRTMCCATARSRWTAACAASDARQRDLRCRRGALRACPGAE